LYEKKDKKFILPFFLCKVQEILVLYEKPDVGIQFPFDEDLFNTMAKKKQKKTKERKDILNVNTIKRFSQR